MDFKLRVLRKSFYIRWSAGRSPRVHEVNPGGDLSCNMSFHMHGDIALNGCECMVGKSTLCLVFD